jgi:methyl-accepting chemotaxis protein
MSSSTDPNVQLLDALKALKEGNLAVRLPTDQPGISKEIAETFNSFMDQTSQLMAEINRLSLEIAYEGKLGGQAQVKGLSGAWKEVHDNVNELEGVVTGQVRAVGNAVQGALESHGLMPQYSYPRNEINKMHAMAHDLIRGISEQRDPAK